MCSNTYKIPAIFSVLPIILVCSLTGCKDSWLDAKPEKTLLVPSSVEDYQAILDNTSLFNAGYPALGEVSADDHYLDYQTWLSGNTMQERQCYIWAPDIYHGETKNYDWDPAFKRILYANIVLEGTEKLTGTSMREDEQLSAVRGAALFYRSLNFFLLSQLFCKPYSVNNLSTPGLPLRLQSNINLKPKRASLAETFEQILADLREAEMLLPTQAEVKTRPTKMAAQSLLARVYLTMHNYENAAFYAEKSLEGSADLLDFNTVDGTVNFPFTVFNDEVVFHYTLTTYSVFSRQAFNVDTTLYHTYQIGDLRRELFFLEQQGRIKYAGSYSGTNNLFGGFTTAEMYLTAAEGKARTGRVSEALDYLNTLLASRYRTGSFKPHSETDPEKLIETILLERRKEVLFRGIRWEDVRRLNAEGIYSITMRRFLNNQWFELGPHDNRYALPIGPDEIALSDLEQNDRR